MSKIGLGQFLKNVFDYSTGKQPTQQSGKIANENFQNAQKDAMRQLNQTAQNIAQNFVQQQEVMITQMQLREFTKYERALLLKQLFDFPENIKDIATFLANETKVLTTKELQLLMAQPIDMAKLVSLLQKNGKEALDKLTKMIVTMNQSGIYDTKQLKEMMTLVNACIPASDASATQIMKNFMLMYLPWLPITGMNDFDITAGENGENNNSEEKDDSLTIFITTKNFGLVKIFLYKEENKYNVDLNCNEKFPKDEFKTALNNVCNTTTTPIDTNVVYTTRKATENKSANNETNIEFSKSSKITPQLLMVVYSIINIVMEIDSKHLENES